MTRAILDEVVPADFITLFDKADLVIAAFPAAWRSLSDGHVIDRAIDGGYVWLITCDKQMPFQQNLAGKPLSVMVLPSARIRELAPIRAALYEALNSPVPGCFVTLDEDGTLVGKPVAHRIGRERTKS